jgi:Tol biopolymer transport system component
MDLWTTRVDGSVEPELLLDARDGLMLGYWTPNGEELVAVLSGEGRQIVRYRPGTDPSPRPLARNAARIEHFPAVSPDGRWIAFVRGEDDNTFRVLLRSAEEPDAGTRVISEGQGILPVWSHDGRELFYVDPTNRQMTVASIDPESARVLGRGDLFAIPVDFNMNLGRDFFDVTEDGDRFLMARAAPQETRLVVVENFDAELQRLLPN